MTSKSKILSFFFISIFILGMIPLHSNAKLFITTQIAVGEIATINNNVIEFDDGSVFHPAKEDTKLEVNPGNLVTIEFYTSPEDVNFYLNIALGSNTLTPSPEPERKEKQPLYGAGNWTCLKLNWFYRRICCRTI